MQVRKESYCEINVSCPNGYKEEIDYDAINAYMNPRNSFGDRHPSYKNEYLIEECCNISQNTQASVKDSLMGTE